MKKIVVALFFVWILFPGSLLTGNCCEMDPIRLFGGSHGFMVSSVASDDPGNNIGKSLDQMKREFPELRYLHKDERGRDAYEDGYPQYGIAYFFYFEEGYVVEEGMVCQQAGGFPRMWYESMVDAFQKGDAEPVYVYKSKNSIHMCYATISIHLIYVSEGGMNTALIVYSKGGSQTGVTRDEFMQQFE